jgi:hypothetical protein
MTGEQWNTNWWVIYQDLLRDGVPEAAAREQADLECAEQFGPEPQ